MNVSVAALLSLFFCVTIPAYGEIRSPDEFFFQSTFSDYSEELEIAAEEGKRGIFLFFEEDDCPFCARMKGAILNRSEVQDYYREHFRIFPVNVKGEIEVVDFSGNEMLEKDFAEQNRARATPMMAFYNPDGVMVVRYTGAASSVDEFLLLGKYAAEQRYLQSSFSRYKRTRRE